MRADDRSNAFRDWLMTGLVMAIAFGVYLMTMCRSVSFIDAGELAAVACVMGIAHPTGYPLFTLTAHLAHWFSFGGNQIVVLNGFSALVVALGVGVFSRVTLVLGKLAKVRDRFLSRSASGLASLVLAFSTTVWAQSAAIEVYGLHILLTLLTILQLLKSYEADPGGDGEIPRSLLAAAFLLGLSFANHLTTLLLVPAALTLYVRQYGAGRGALKRAVKLLPLFLSGLSVYLYLPLRAHALLPVQWGYPADVERLFWHISGKQYRNWMFSGFESAAKQFSYFAGHFSSEFHWLVIAILVYGLLRLYRAEKTLFWFFVTAFVGCVLYSINYDIYDIDSYFLLAYLASGVFAFFGIVALLEIVWRNYQAVARMLSVILLLALPAFQISGNYSSVDESDNFLTEDYLRTVLSNTAPNALILTYQWDYFISPSLYYQAVKKERPDVAVIDKELLRRSWYFVHLKSRFPWLIERSQGKVDAFLVELSKFEHDLPYNSGVIEERYVAMINDFIVKSMRDRPVYVGPEIEPEFGAWLVRVPSGLM
ncbi:MAG TPA: hypothetical protein DEP53_15515, partial [Bacteroidetes bacterium]|nr:hypothetical protein [Bacteroidota bacterium]